MQHAARAVPRQKLLSKPQPYQPCHRLSVPRMRFGSQQHKWAAPWHRTEGSLHLNGVPQGGARAVRAERVQGGGVAQCVADDLLLCRSRGRREA